MRDDEHSYMPDSEKPKAHVEVHNEWDPLRHVIVGVADGACIPPPEPAFNARLAADSDMRGRHGSRTEEAIARANEQLDGFAHILEKRGVRVDRPTPIPFEQQAVRTPDFSLYNSTSWGWMSPRVGRPKSVFARPRP